MEDSKQTNRLTLAVYLFLAALAIILALIGIKYIQNDSPTRDLIINLSTEILGVVIIFFIVNQLFLLNKEKDFTKQIESLKDGIKSKFSPLVWEFDIKDKLRLEEWFLKAKSIYILGYNQAKLLQTIRPILLDSINKGTFVKILIVDPESIAGDLFRKNSINDDWILRFQKYFKICIRNKN